MQSRQPDNQHNLLIAILLSVGVLMAWQFFYAGPKMKKEQEARKQVELQKKKAAEQKAKTQAPTNTKAPTTAPGTPAAPATTAKKTATPTPTPATGSKEGAPPTPGKDGSAPAVPGTTKKPGLARQAALDKSPRIKIRTPSLTGSISLQGGRIDDLKLINYRETQKPNSPNVILFSPSAAQNPYFAEFGWVAQPNDKLKLPGPKTIWRAEGTRTLAPGRPVSMTWNNGQGLTFKRTVSVDADYMFKIVDSVENKTAKTLTLFPYGRIFRYGTPKIEGFFIAHEGLIGVLGKKGYQEITYSDVQADDGSKQFKSVSGGWLGFTDKYWAATLIPGQKKPYTANLKLVAKKSPTSKESFQADYLGQPIVVTPNTTGKVSNQLFAGAKRVGLVETYGEKLKIEKFDLLIDWGWFHFITRPMFYLLNWLYELIGNFGVAIIAVTIIVKIIFFPLANKSYESMAKMKKLQPEMERLRDRYKDDKARQQQALMELYKKEKINPLAGCLPILIQIPVFFALYKVLFVTIDMRHAPFFGWIQDLSAPDSSSLFNLFGLLPFAPPEAWLLGHTIGAWPLMMGATMWLQMQLNPQQPDPIQQQIFNWMPVIFTVLLAGFAAGLVIYWFWNNILSIAQQWVIMKRQGVDVPLIDNLRKTLDPVLKLIDRYKKKAP